NELPISAPPGHRTLSCRLCTRVNPRCIGSGTSAQVHPYRPANRKAERDDLRTGEGAEQKTIVLGADKLDDEPLDSRQHAVQSEQPALGVLVIAQAPQDQKHHETKRDLVELRWIHREDLIRRRSLGRRNEKEISHVGDGGRRRAMRKADYYRSVVWAAVVLARRSA